MIASLLIAVGLAAASPAPLDIKPGDCTRNSPDEVLVCGRKTERYRIDPSVLQAEREHDALPAKPSLTADAAPSGGCVGGTGTGCTGGGVIPLVGMAEVAIKAVALAASGDDWRDALRTHQDEYRLYEEEQARKAEARKPRIGLSVGR